MFGLAKDIIEVSNIEIIAIDIGYSLTKTFAAPEEIALLSLLAVVPFVIVFCALSSYGVDTAIVFPEISTVYPNWSSTSELGAFR